MISEDRSIFVRARGWLGLNTNLWMVVNWNVRGHPIDINKMHRFLWRRSDRLGRLRLSQRDFAKELGVAHETVSRIFSRMTEAGMIKRIRSERNNIGIYAIVDPDEFTSEPVA